MSDITRYTPATPTVKGAAMPLVKAFIETQVEGSELISRATTRLSPDQKQELLQAVARNIQSLLDFAQVKYDSAPDSDFAVFSRNPSLRFKIGQAVRMLQQIEENKATLPKIGFAEGDMKTLMAETMTSPAIIKLTQKYRSKTLEDLLADQEVVAVMERDAPGTLRNAREIVAADAGKPAVEDLSPAEKNQYIKDVFDAAVSGNAVLGLFLRIVNAATSGKVVAKLGEEQRRNEALSRQIGEDILQKTIPSRSSPLIIRY